MFKVIGHFWVPKTLTFKTRLIAKLFFWNEFYLHENKKNNFHDNGFALSLDLEQRLQATRKWSINTINLPASSKHRDDNLWWIRRKLLFPLEVVYGENGRKSLP